MEAGEEVPHPLSEHEELRYDRQLRLWGHKGQQDLARAHVVALGATVTTTEALKCLCMAGVGAITVVDERLVDEEMLATNFFVPMEAAGGELATAVVTSLGALNPSVVGFAVRCPLSQWVEHFAAAVPETVGGPHDERARRAWGERAGRWTLPITGDAAAAAARWRGLPSLILASHRYPDFSPGSALVRAGEAGDVPVLCVESKGLLGFLQTFSRDRVVLRTHPPPNSWMEDLRLFRPFPALDAWLTAHDPVVVHKHGPDVGAERRCLPYHCVWHHALRRWVARQPVPPTLPLAAPAYREIQAIMADMMQHTVQPPLPCLTEAFEKCTCALNRPLIASPPPSLSRLLAHRYCAQPLAAARPVVRGAPAHTSPPGVFLESEVLLWYALAAVRAFIAPRPAEKEPDRHGFVSVGEVPGELPFCGHVPEFTASPEWTRELREVYRAKYDADVEGLFELAWGAIQAEARAHATAFSVSEETCLAERLRGTVGEVVQSIWTVSLVEFEAVDLPQRETDEAWRRRVAARVAHAVQSAETDVVQGGAYLAAAVWAAQEVRRRFGFEPGDELPETASPSRADAVLREVALLLSMRDADGTVERLPEALRRACWEVTRPGSSEVPSVAASVGALAAQESVKLLQGQRLPVGRPVLYNGYANTLHLLEVEGAGAPAPVEDSP